MQEEVKKNNGQMTDFTKQGKVEEWNRFADLLANLIEKYEAVLDNDSLPDPQNFLEKESDGKENISDM